MKVTGLENEPANVDTVFDYPRPNSIVLKDCSANLWVYNGNSWNKITSGVNAPKSVYKVFGHPDKSSIVIEDNEEHNLWVYESNVWYQQTGGVNQVTSVDLMFMVHQRELQQ